MTVARWVGDSGGRPGSQEPPVVLRAPLRGRGRTVLGRAARRPLRVAAALRAGTSAQHVAGLLLLQDTVAALGLTGIEGLGSAAFSLAEATPGRALRGGSAITAVVIAQDEEVLLPGALASVRELVSEIVVVDGGSRDGTVEAAEAAGAAVVHRPFDHDFSAQRNAGLARVRTPWALTLDADERPEPALLPLLRDVVATTRAQAVCVPRLNLVGDDPVPTLWPDLPARVFRSSLRYRGRVHEELPWRSAVRLPLNGPLLLHHKPELRHYRNALGYSRIDSSPYTADELAWLASRVRELEGEDT